MNYMEEYSRGIISILLRESPCGGFEWGYVIAGILANKNYIGLSSEIFMMRKQVRQIFFFSFFPVSFPFYEVNLDRATGSRISGSRQPKTKFRTGFSSAFVIRHSNFWGKEVWNLLVGTIVPQLQRRGISSDSQNCPEMEKENQVTIAIVT